MMPPSPIANKGLQDIIPYSFIANNEWRRWECPSTMTMPTLRRNPNDATVTHSSNCRRRKGKDCDDRDGLLLQKRSRGWDPLTGPRATLSDMAQVQQPLERGRPIVRSLMVWFLYRGITDRNNHWLNQGLLNGALKIVSTHTQSWIQYERHIREGKCTLKWGRKKHKRKNLLEPTGHDHNKNAERETKVWWWLKLSVHPL